MSRRDRILDSPGVMGCLAAFALLVAASLLISGVCTSALRLITVETERAVIAAVWLVALGVGGCVAARRVDGRWTSALSTGVLAEIFLLGQLLRGHDPEATFFDPLLEVLRHPTAHWPLIVKLVLTIPAALLGGVLARGRAAEGAKTESQHG